MELYDFQQAAVDFFKDKEAGGIFYKMGTGKTIIALAIFLQKAEAGLVNRLLVIAPTGVHQQWVREINKFAPDVEAFAFGGKGKHSRKFPVFSGNRPLQALCVNIETFSTDAKWKQPVQWALKNKAMIILDEAACIKGQSKRSHVVSNAFNVGGVPYCKYRFALTGTPISNAVTDIWSIMNFVRPNFFNRSFYAFRGRYALMCKLPTVPVPTNITRSVWHAVKKSSFETALRLYGVSYDDYNVIQQSDRFLPAKHTEEIMEKLKTCCVWQSEEPLHLPPKVYATHSYSLNEAELKALQGIIEDNEYTWDDVLTEAPNAMLAMLRKRQVVSGFISGNLSPDILLNMKPEELNAYLEKMEHTSEVRIIGDSRINRLFEDIEAIGEKVVVFTSFLSSANRIADTAAKKGIPCFRGGGNTVRELSKFEEAEEGIFVAPIAATAVGFNMQFCHYALFFENTMSYDLRQQAEARIHRAGQTDTCFYIDYTAEECDIDLQMQQLLAAKSTLAEALTGDDMSSRQV